MTMRTLILLALSAIFVVAEAGPKPLPEEVEAFIAERNTCDHFRGEPYEGNSPEQIERRTFIMDSLDIFCSGTDRRLAALKRRYKNNLPVMKELNKFEEKVETMHYHDGSPVALGDLVDVPIPSGTARARVVMLGETYEHLDIDPGFLSWIKADRVLRPLS